MNDSNERRLTSNVAIRHMEFNFNPAIMCTHVWYDNAFASAYILTFSVLIPHGEMLVINAVRAYRDETSDPELRARVNGLIGQEAMHSSVHEAFNQAYASKGLPLGKIDSMGKWLYSKLAKRSPRAFQLSLTCWIEHLTACMAEQVFSKDHLPDELDPQARDFLIWHLLEECEHKAVAFDLYDEMVGRYWLRMVGVVVFTLFVGTTFFIAMRLILRSPGFARNSREQVKGVRFWFGRQGYFARLRPKMSAYLRRDFHPDQSDTGQDLADWRERIFGAQGMLRDNVTRVVMPRARLDAGPPDERENAVRL